MKIFDSALFIFASTTIEVTFNYLNLNLHVIFSLPFLFQSWAFQVKSHFLFLQTYLFGWYKSLLPFTNLTGSCNSSFLLYWSCSGIFALLKTCISASRPFTLRLQPPFCSFWSPTPDFIPFLSILDCYFVCFPGGKRSKHLDIQSYVSTNYWTLLWWIDLLCKEIMRDKKAVLPPLSIIVSGLWLRTTIQLFYFISLQHCIEV